MYTALHSFAVPMYAADAFEAAWTDPVVELPAGHIVAPREEGEITAQMLRQGVDMPAIHVERTPVDMVVVRIFLAPCTLSVLLGTQWAVLGDMLQGGMHASHAHQVVRTEWHAAAEGLMLCIPASLWRHADAATTSAQPLDLSVDTTLLQLTKMLLNSPQCESDSVFFRHMVGVIVARIGVWRKRGLPPGGARNALPRWRLQRVMAYVHEHLAESISLADMATAAGISPMHFAAQFRSATGLRPHHYLLQCRIQHAKALLADASRSLIDVAICAGFRTQAHFTTVFKNLEQMTPMQWRRSRLDGHS